MTYEEMIDVVLAIWRYVVRALALLGFFALVATASYLYHKGQKPEKIALRDVCINSACDQPCNEKPSRFTRHKGECK